MTRRKRKQKHSWSLGTTSLIYFYMVSALNNRFPNDKVSASIYRSEWWVDRKEGEVGQGVGRQADTNDCVTLGLEVGYNRIADERKWN